MGQLLMNITSITTKVPKHHAWKTLLTSLFSAAILLSAEAGAAAVTDGAKQDSSTSLVSADAQIALVTKRSSDKIIRGEECEEESFDCDFEQECEDGEDCGFEQECEDGEECELEIECQEGEDCDFEMECEEGEDCGFEMECEDGEDCDFEMECEEGEDCGFEMECEDCDFEMECEEGENCEFEPECEDGENCEFEPECEEGENCDTDTDTDTDTECEEGEECEDNPPIDTTSAIGICPNANPERDLTEVEVTREAANRASRFLSQATFGASYATITQVAQMGEEAWLQQQFTQPEGLLTPHADCLAQALQAAAANSSNEDDAFGFVGIPESFRRNAWWTQAVTSPDPLRQRVAMALSEIFVVSQRSDDLNDSYQILPSYYDMLLTNSFGNYRDILAGVTAHPAMGIYLSHINNAKADPVLGTFPDENYAREVMQLFSIGLFELNADGSRRLDGSGQAIPTYGSAEIREFAKVFTGYTFAGAIAFDEEGEEDGIALTQPMQLIDSAHDMTEKRLLNGTVLPAGQSASADINAALDNLFNHPNVGPFFGRLMIQRLVTSNPSPAYVARVTAAFNGSNGAPRGDMKNLLQAILLDPEARQEPNADNSNMARLREPFLTQVHMARAFNLTSADNTFSDSGEVINEQIQQYVFNSPSVFNFFQPGFAPNGELRDAGLAAPEFQIVTASTVIGMKNRMVEALFFDGLLQTEGALAPAQFNLAPELAIAADPQALLDRLDTTLTHGTLTQASKDAILTAIQQVEDPEIRVRLAIYLVTASPDYAVVL